MNYLLTFFVIKRLSQLQLQSHSAPTAAAKWALAAIIYHHRLVVVVRKCCN